MEKNSFFPSHGLVEFEYDVDLQKAINCHCRIYVMILRKHAKLIHVQL